MSAVWRRVLASLAVPDDQGNDWFSWGAVQLAHAAIGVALAGLCIVAGLAPGLAAIVSALGYGAAKEIPDLMRVPTWRTARDSLRDALFVAGGACVAASLAAGSAVGFGVSLGAVVIGLAIGVYQRAAAEMR